MESSEKRNRERRKREKRDQKQARRRERAAEKLQRGAGSGPESAPEAITTLGPLAEGDAAVPRPGGALP